MRPIATASAAKMVLVKPNATDSLPWHYYSNSQGAGADPGILQDCRYRKAFRLSIRLIGSTKALLSKPAGPISLTNSIRPDAIGDIAAADRVRFIGISVVFTADGIGIGKSTVIRADRTLLLSEIA